MNSETVAIKPFLALLLMALVRSETVPAETKACQFDLMRRCNHKFRESFAPDAAFGKDFDQVYCNGLQVFMDCVESDPCHGVLIDNYRFVLLQHALMDKKMNVCPKHQFLKLKEKVSNVIKSQHLATDDIEFEDPDEMPCARQAHHACTHNFTQAMETQGNMCGTLQGFIQCYEEAAAHCQTAITKKFYHLCKQLGKQMLRINRMKPGVMC